MPSDNPITKALGYVDSADAHLNSILRIFTEATKDEQYIISLHVEEMHLRLERRRTFGER